MGEIKERKKERRKERKKEKKKQLLHLAPKPIPAALFVTLLLSPPPAASIDRCLYYANHRLWPAAKVL